MENNITRRQYNSEKAQLTAKLEEVKHKLATLSERSDNGTITRAEIDSWNDLHDLEDDTLKELHWLDTRWNRRNWTHSDYTIYELISQNID